MLYRLPAFAAGAVAFVYSLTVAVAAVTAVAARTPVRRRDARRALKILLIRR